MSNYNLQELTHFVVEMGALCEEMLKESLSSSSTLEAMESLENKTNTFHKQIDDYVYKLLALNAPVATDLRCALICLKINTELERLADYALGLKRIFLKAQEFLKENAHLLSPLEQMQKQVLKALKNSLNAFVCFDAKSARQLILEDEQINNSYHKAMLLYLQTMKTNSDSIEECFNCLRSAKIFERMGDHITNIAEDIIFWIDGHDIRHSRLK